MNLLTLSRIVLISAPLALAACATTTKENVVLRPQAERVDVAVDPPSTEAYKLVGEVSGEAAGTDPTTARFWANNDLRNNAAALGASCVTIDRSRGERLFMQDKMKVVLVGRAYKTID